MKSSKERQAIRRDKLSHGGLFKRRDFWVRPQDEHKLREIEKRLREEALKEI